MLNEHELGVHNPNEISKGSTGAVTNAPKEFDCQRLCEYVVRMDLGGNESLILAKLEGAAAGRSLKRIQVT